MIITIEELQALHENMIQLYHEWQRAGHLLDQGKIESREYEWKLYAKARDTYLFFSQKYKQQNPRRRPFDEQ